MLAFKQLLSGMVGDMLGASGTVELSGETMTLQMGAMGSVANGQAERLDNGAQNDMLGLSLGTLGSTAGDGTQVRRERGGFLAERKARTRLVRYRGILPWGAVFWSRENSLYPPSPVFPRPLNLPL